MFQKIHASMNSRTAYKEACSGVVHIVTFSERFELEDQRQIDAVLQTPRHVPDYAVTFDSGRAFTCTTLRFCQLCRIPEFAERVDQAR